MSEPLDVLVTYIPTEETARVRIISRLIIFATTVFSVTIFPRGFDKEYSRHKWSS